jgi:MoxR-like ATPase
MSEAQLASLDEVLARLDALVDAPLARPRVDQPDVRDGSVYRCPPELVLALKVALVTGRPLLLYGWPGSGKSSLAAYVARNLGWRYYEHVVTARTEAADLLWRFDHVRRLADAQVRKGGKLRNFDYVEPGALWWTLDPESARRRGAPTDELAPATPTDPYGDVNRDRDDRCAVLLIDELDKADPDVPSSLLVPLGSLRFTVTDSGTEVGMRHAGEDASCPRRLVIITTNEERDLPAPFVRRCVVHRLEFPDADVLEEITERHLRAEGRKTSRKHAKRIRALAEQLVASRPDEPAPDDHLPSTAEFLDAVHVLLDMGDRLSPADWALVERLTLQKRTAERA